jgi:hypothetical protein
VKVLGADMECLVTYRASKICKMTASILGTSLGWKTTSTLQMLRTLVMKLPKLKDCGDDIVQAAKIKIMAPHYQKLAKDGLSDDDVSFLPFLTKTRRCCCALYAINSGAVLVISRCEDRVIK